MGYRCPNCHKDFGSDKPAFRIHMTGCGNADLQYKFYTDQEAFKREIEDFIRFSDRLKEKTDKLGTKAEREAFYRKIGNERNTKYL